MSNPKSIIIVPTYNEADNIFQLLGVVRDKVPAADILVVDDSSPDGTADRVRLYQRSDDQVFLLERPKKDGLTGAYFAGFNWAIERHYDRVLQMDADFSHDPGVAEEMLRGLDEADLVMATRYGNGGATSGWSKLRKTVSRTANLYATTILSFPFADITSGYNAWRVSALKKLDYSTIKSKGYVYQVELKYRAHRLGLTMKEVPFTFTERRSGVSKINVPIIAEAAWCVLKLLRT